MRAPSRSFCWCGLVLAISLGAPHAAAQEEGSNASPDPVEALVTGPESPELRALRMLERELFGGATPVDEEADGAGSVRISAGPPAVSSEAPASGAEAPARSSRDLSFLRDLTLPDIPVRWDERVIRYLEFFRDEPRGQRFIRAWMQRLNRYGPTIRRTLEHQGLPRDLIFVAMVESGFDPVARSHASAAGMWQFMKPTGQELGLTVDHWVDMRLDPERATDAAGRYLGQLYERFGAWELAFSAYNMGYGALLRSIRKYNTNDYWTLAHLEAALPFETTLYVSKIIACAIVAHNLTRFGLADLEQEAPIRWETVSVPGGTTLRQVARAAGADLDTLRALNPALRRDRTPPSAERWDVHIPPEAHSRFTERWARAQPRDAGHRTHVLRFGETLADLAHASGVSEADLAELNGVQDGERVGAGTTLLVPVVPNRRARARGDDEALPVIAVPEGPREIPGRRRVFYRVVRGDALADIARFFRVEVDEIRRWNQVDPSAELQSGMFLQLFVRPEVDLGRALVLTPDECRALVVGSEEFFAYHEGQNGRIRFRYRVRAGDTLSEIAQRFGIPTSSLARINQIGRRATIHPDQELIIYAEPSRVPRELRPPPATPEVEGDAPSEGAETVSEGSVPPRDDGAG